MSGNIVHQSLWLLRLYWKEISALPLDAAGYFFRAQILNHSCSQLATASKTGVAAQQPESA